MKRSDTKHESEVQEVEQKDTGSQTGGPFVTTDSEAHADPSTSSGSSPPESRDDARLRGPDRADAERFIAALAGSATSRVTFQTFHDSNKGTSEGRIFHGTLAEHWGSLTELNQRGHGIYILINEGDFAGRKKANVVNLRSLFIDDDGHGEPVAFTGPGNEPFAKLSPSMTVQSKAGQHNYFQLLPGEALEGFTSAQAALASHFGTDPAVKDISRVMRVPGFFHMKNPSAPYLVKLVQVNATRYTIKQVLTAYPAVESTSPPPVPPQHEAHEASPRNNACERARKYVEKVPPAVQGEGGDRKTFSLCATLARGFDLSDEDCMSLLLTWNDTCQPPWTEEELSVKLKNAREYGTEEIGGRLKASAKGGESSWVLPTEFAALCDIFRDHDQRSRALGVEGELEMDMRTGTITLGRKPFGHDVDINSIRENLTKHLRPDGWKGKFEFTKESVQDALQRVAAEKRYHPVQEYLSALAWDGTSRIAEIPSTVLGIPTNDKWTELYSVLLKRWFISAVARALKPGCKVDTVLILVGKQGRKKSTFFSVLGGEWFTDSPIDMENKDGMLLLGKTWIVELAELDSMAKARNQTAVKAFISRQTDAYRPPYARVTVEVHRTSVFVGTTNEEEFLPDSTGNRRYWPVSGCNKEINIELLGQWRDQLWAEAVHLYRRGEQWHLTEDEETQLAEKLRDHERLDPWHSTIEEYVAGKTQVQTREVLGRCLDITKDRQTKAEEMRVSHTLKLLGFRSTRCGEKRERVWVREK